MDTSFSENKKRLLNLAVKKGQEIELDITQVAFGGRGLTRVDGLAVFVDQAVTGDRVLARVVKKKKNYIPASNRFQI